MRRTLLLAITSLTLSFLSTSAMAHTDHNAIPSPSYANEIGAGSGNIAIAFENQPQATFVIEQVQHSPSAITATESCSGCHVDQVPKVNRNTQHQIRSHVTAFSFNDKSIKKRPNPPPHPEHLRS